MPYTPRPFNPTTPYENQVVIELEKANENFDLLKNAFVNNSVESGVVKNSDTVDGFHASLTPAPNVIVPLNENGVLNLSASFVKSDVYTFRRVDLTNATSDYLLQVGEEAVIRLNNESVKPLGIKTVEGIYLLIGFFPSLPYVVSCGILPNNTSYSGAFRRTTMYNEGSSATVYNWKDNQSGIFYEQVAGGGLLMSYISTFTNNKCEIHFMVFTAQNYNWAQHMQVAHIWKDTTTPWTSLGTFTAGANITATLLVRRLA